MNNIIDTDLEITYLPYDYNTPRLSLPLNLEPIFPVDDEAVTFAELMKGFDCTKYLVKAYDGDYDKRMLLYVVLFGYMINKKLPSLRDLENFCKYDIRFMWLSNYGLPSFMSFQRFIASLEDCLEDLFYEFNKYLIEIDKINTDDLFLDGTKEEATSTKFSFVWKKAVLNYQGKLFVKISDLYKEINDYYETTVVTVKNKYQYNDLDFITIVLEEAIKLRNIELVYGKGKRKSQEQRFYDKLVEYKGKLLEYARHIVICGDRNSYSKTDHDATFMHMKEDYYCKTGVFKAGYNIQVGVSDGYALVVDVFQNPGDTPTFIPMMELYFEQYGYFPKNPMSDAAYGSYDNYAYCEEVGMNKVMKYSMYAKKNEAGFKKKLYNKINWERNEDGHYICPEGKVFDVLVREQNNTKNGMYTRIDELMTCNSCEGCPVKSKCTKANGNRTIQVNKTLDRYYDDVDELLGTENGKELKKQRSIQAEGIFADVKSNRNFNRCTRRGIGRVKVEVLLALIGHNLRTYHNKHKNDIAQAA